MDIGQFSRYPAQNRRGRWSGKHTAIATAFFVIAALALGAWYSQLRSRAEDLAGRLQRVEKEQANLAGTVAETQRARARLQGFVDASNRAVAKGNGTTLGPALRIVGAAVEPGMEIASISAPAEDAASGGWRLRLEGTVTGVAPRVLADRCRWKLQEGLARSYALPEPPQLEHREAGAAEAAGGAIRKAGFAISAAIAPGKPTEAGDKGPL